MKGNENKHRIGLFGRRNVGKSTLFNCLIGQQIAIVSDTPGTTTDPVRKTVELEGIGPVVLIDTAGVDDEGLLGAQRVAKTMAELSEVDLAVVVNMEWSTSEQQLADRCLQMGTPMLRITPPAWIFEADLTASDPRWELLRNQLVQQIVATIPTCSGATLNPLADVVHPGDTVILVAPIDSAAPAGRLILPQVQVLRWLLDLHARAVVCQPDELTPTLLHDLPTRLVIADSQVFGRVATVVPNEVALTSFSCLLARQKGPFDAYLAGTPTIAHLHDGDRILLLESCAHTLTCEDIGRVKLPAALRRATGRDLQFDFLQGADALAHPIRPIGEYALVVQCGGCNITSQQLRARLLPAIEAGVPVSNYGLTLAWCAGIFDRATRLFDPSTQPQSTTQQTNTI